MTNRKVVTAALKLAVTGYYTKQRYGVYHELGVAKWGKLKADVVALNRKGHIVICEVKSCWADYSTDHKWQGYLPYCNQFYLCVTHDFWTKYGPKLGLPKECGVIVLLPTGLTRVVKSSPIRKMQGSTKKDMIIRMAWRAATYSLYQGTRRQRVYIKE